MAKKVKEPKADKKVFSFPSKSRCPRCGTMNTRRVGENRGGNIQYRVCTAPVCAKRYSEFGKEV